MSNKTGGRAFPCDSIVERDEVGHLHGFEVSSGGMTLRDYFAAKALIVAARGADGEPEWPCTTNTTGLRLSAKRMSFTLISCSGTSGTFLVNAAIEDPSINSFPQVRFRVGPDWLRKPVPVGVIPDCLA